MSDPNWEATCILYNQLILVLQNEGLTRLSIVSVSYSIINSLSYDFLIEEGDVEDV